DLMRRLQTAGWRPWYLPAVRLGHLVPEAKCNVAHVGDRREASAYEIAGGRPPEPVRALRWRVARTWWEWRWATARGRKGYRQYVEYRRTRGILRRMRDEGALGATA